MRKILLLAVALLLIGNLAKAQIFIDGKQLREENTQFVEIEFFNTVGSADVRMFIDYGQNVGFLDRRSRIVSDKRGKALIFNSSVHGLNWLYEKGYGVLNVYNPQSGGQAVNNDIIYLMEKRKDYKSISEE